MVRYLLEIHGTHSQRSLGVILNFSLAMETVAAQMPAIVDLTVAYQPMGSWHQPQNPSCPVASALVQQRLKYTGLPLNSLPIDFQTQNTNSFPLLYNNFHLFPNSINSSGVQQQQQMNTSQPTQQDFTHTPDSRPSPLAQPHYSPPSPEPPLFPLIKQNSITSPDDRRLKCNKCPQSFNRNHDLKRHKRIHLAVKPFPCGHCEKSFSRKDALKVRCLFD